MSKEAKWKVILFMGVFWLFETCCPRLVVIQIRSFDDLKNYGHEIANQNQKNTGCQDPSNYIPDQLRTVNIPFRRIQMNVHFMNAVDSQSNYYGDEAVRFAKDLIYHANKRLAENAKMNLPENNITKVIPANYGYEISPLLSGEGQGIYFHFDDELYYFINKGRYRNNYSNRVIDKYSIGIDSIVNVFIMPHHPDSIVSSSYAANASGVALGNAVKIAIRYDTREVFWKYGGLLNHEMGHVLGLKHSWNEEDGCVDTPRNDNCWNISDNPPCNGLVSNNMMDYNVSQLAITPCQLGMIHRNFSTLNTRQRRILKHNWCSKNPEDSQIVLNSNEHWTQAMDLTNDLVIKSGFQLIISCRLSIPKGGIILVEPDAELILITKELSNDCGFDWEGIKMYNQGNQKASLKFIPEFHFN